MAHQCALHIDRQLLLLRQCVDGFGVAGLQALGLILNDAIRPACLPCVAKQQIVLQFVQHIRIDAQRVDHHPIPVELHKVEATEAGRVLVLKTALYRQVMAFDAIGRFRNIVWRHAYVLKFFDQPNQRDDERGGRTQTGPRRRIAVQEDLKPRGILRAETVNHCLHEIQLAIRPHFTLRGVIQQ